MERTVPFLNVCISFVAFITALILVVYMLVSFVTGTYDVAIQIFDTIFLEPAERQSILNALNTEFLHTIALLIVLMKAYRILVEYMRWYHIDIKYMMEIGIIASVLELLFNYQSYSIEMRYIFLGIAVSFAAIYAFRHDTLVSAMRESRNENRQWLKDANFVAGYKGFGQISFWFSGKTIKPVGMRFDGMNECFRIVPRFEPSQRWPGMFVRILVVIQIVKIASDPPQSFIFIS
jgi:uncharacterized membrane protein (DUF373 family)